MQNDL
jgi:hypothetical protein